MKKHYTVPSLPLGYDLETKAVLRQVNKARYYRVYQIDYRIAMQGSGYVHQNGKSGRY